MKTPQLWTIIICLFAALLMIQARGDVDKVPPSVPLEGFPTSLGSYHGEDVPISSASLEILGKGDFLNRIYTKGSESLARPAATPGTLPVQLFIAYFPTQRSGQSIHSPQNCLPGSGWTFVHSGVTDFQDRTGKSYRVGDYVISDGRSKQEVLYWYQSHGRSIASDYKAKLLMVTDAIRDGRTDAALVRIITAVANNEAPDAAHQRLIAFAKTVTPLLPAYVPN